MFRVHGKVQHVFFRRDTKLLADSLGLFGHVKNESDGSVSGKVGGHDNLVDQFLEVIKTGVNDKAKVHSFETTEITQEYDTPSNIKTFEILK